MNIARTCFINRKARETSLESIRRVAGWTRRILGFASVAICVLAVPHAYAEDAAAQANPKVVPADWIVAVVNNEAISRKELDDKVVSVSAQLKAQGSALPPPDVMRKQVLEKMIIDHAQLQFAKDKGMQVDDSILDRALQKIADQNHMTMQSMRDQVEKEGTSFPVFREEIRDELTLQRVQQYEVISKIQVSDSEVDNFLAQQSASKGPQQEYHVAHILVHVPENASSEVIRTRYERAQDIVRQLRAGADFAKTAASYSDADDALQGGDLGWRGTNRLPQVFVDAIAPLKQGEVTEPIRTANGFHIVGVLGKRAPSLLQSSSAPAVMQTHAEHILIKTNQVVSLDDARAKLMEIRSRIVSGSATFEEMAKQYSNDLTASRGGDLGWLYPGDTVADFEKAMDALKPGEISEPVESPFGMHLIKVLERKTEDASKDRQHLAARQALRDRKVDEATQEWLSQLRDRTYVEYHLDEK